MKKKIISLIVIISVVVAILLGSMISFANETNSSLYVGLSKTDVDGVGYGNGNPEPENGGTSNAGEYIWNIRTHDSTDLSDISETQRNLYCVNADYGDTWFNQNSANFDITKVLEYKLSYDLQNSNTIAELQAVLKDNSDDGIEGLFKEGTDGVYKVSNEILWLLDNLYVPSNTLEVDVDVNTYLAKVGILKDLDDNRYYYEENDNWVYTEETPKEEEIAKDIIAVQRMAIWYFTDGIDKTGENSTAWLFVDEGEGYGLLSEPRNKIAVYLYNYLIQQAKANANQYTGKNNLTVDTENLEKQDNKFIVQTKLVDGKYITGPIVIEKENDNPFDIGLAVTNSTGTVNFDYVITDANGTPITDATIENVVGKTDGFYISTNTIDDLNITITEYPTHTTKTLWLVGSEDETTGEKIIAGEQPIVEIEKPDPEITILTAKPFDLALRKYITAVEKTNKDGTTTTKTIENARNLNNISLDSLLNGTTATYNHRKDPVVVEENDIVTYTLRIYNEGSKAGYATKIIDQLPNNLILIEDTSKPIVSIGKDGKEKNRYSLEESTSMTTTNQIVLKIVDTTENPAQSLNAYTSNNLDYETLEIRCKVIQKASTIKDDKIVLTNVAWIQEAYDAEDKKIVSTEGTVDRDSQPQNSPNVDKGNMTNYRGTTSTDKELSDADFFYKGQQDDDDFEKLVIMPIEKKFDLALFKHIAAISKDQKIENGEYVTDTGNIDGTYLRAPVVTAIDPETGKITYKEDDKAALVVEPGDYVLYTIRVYNEGEINGYASKIKDTLPIGLEFVLDNEEYNGIWNLEPILDSEGRQVVTTTWYAKGQGAELDAKEGDVNYKANLLNALNKEGAVSNIEPANPDFLDAQVLCRVVEQATSNRVLVNYAQISDDTDEEGKTIEDVDSTPDEWIDEDDDQDIERIQLQYFDLSLRKFITALNGTELKNSEGKYEREPVVDVSNLVNKTGTTAVYTHPKSPLDVQVGDKIVYTIRVYNEGDIDGYASEVKDYLPPYLTYVTDSEINTLYKWQVSDDGRIITTRYLADRELQAFDGTKLDYADLKIECIVLEKAPLKQNQTNIAEISEYTYNGGTAEKDIDSTSDNMENKIPADKELPGYKDEEINKPYVPGNEDDDDFEKVYVQQFDLALRKFITKIQENEVTTRVPQVDTTPLKNGENTAIYTHPKDALTVHVGDVVIYTLRIFNEGEIDGYASEITDDIPEYLEYLPEDSTNVEYMWKMYDENGNETENVEEAVKVKTEYLSKENGEDKLIKAFDGETLSYKDIKIAFKVKDPNSNTYIITNYAQISNDTDKNGNTVKDKDSEPDQWNEGEDDQDIENVKVQYFDLSLLKFVSKVIVIEDGKEKITETGYNGHENPEPVVKVELHKKKLSDVVVKFGYGITITNEGDIPGYATEITDYVPEGLKFEASDNPEWTDEGNNVISTRQLEDILLQPGESTTVEVIFTWINGKDNLALKTNTAEISEDKNEYDVPDRDSTPDNKKEGEDDIDIAKVILAITTGSTQTYFMLTLGLLTIILVGIILIKKFVI